MCRNILNYMCNLEWFFTFHGLILRKKQITEISRALIGNFCWRGV